MSAQLVAGVCRFCRGTEENPSKTVDGDDAGWTDFSRTCCTAPKCLAYAAMEPKIKRDRQRHAVADLVARKKQLVAPIVKRMDARKSERKAAAKLRMERRKGDRA